jgi:hypothetical protein
MPKVRVKAALRPACSRKRSSNQARRVSSQTCRFVFERAARALPLHVFVWVHSAQIASRAQCLVGVACLTGMAKRSRDLR